MRETWDQYFLGLAQKVATRSTCDRAHVGAVIVNHKRIIATGYNGSPSGAPHCDDAGHLLREINGRQSCVRTLHAESNAIDYAGRETACCVLYCTHKPCYECAKRIVNARIWRVVYGIDYESQNADLVTELFKNNAIQLVNGSKDSPR